MLFSEPWKKVIFYIDLWTLWWTLLNEQNAFLPVFIYTHCSCQRPHLGRSKRALQGHFWTALKVSCFTNINPFNPEDFVTVLELPGIYIKCKEYEVYGDISTEKISLKYKRNYHRSKDNKYIQEGKMTFFPLKSPFIFLFVYFYFTFLLNSRKRGLTPLPSVLALSAISWQLRWFNTLLRVNHFCDFLFLFC